MKKRISLILTIILFSILSKTCLAAEVDFSPKWSNIAPFQYSENMQYIENNTFNKKHPVLSVFTAMTLVGVPVVVISKNKSEEIETNNYWYMRKNEFDEQVNFCKQMNNNDNKMACFNNLIQAEHSKTAQHEQMQLQQRANAINAYNGLQLQNSINNLNNSINRPATYMQTGNFIYKY